MCLVFVLFHFISFTSCSTAFFPLLFRCHSHDVHSSFMSVLCFLTQIVTCPRGARFFTTSLGQGCRRSHPGPAQGHDSICVCQSVTFCQPHPDYPTGKRLSHQSCTLLLSLCHRRDDQVYPQLSSNIPGMKWSRRQNNKLVNAVADITGIA